MLRVSWGQHLKFLTSSQLLRTRPIPNNNKLVPLVGTKEGRGRVTVCYCVLLRVSVLLCYCVTAVWGVLSVALTQQESMQGRI